MLWHVNDDPVANLQIAEVCGLSALIEGRLGSQRQRLRGIDAQRLLTGVFRFSHPISSPERDARSKDPPGKPARMKP